MYKCRKGDYYRYLAEVFTDNKEYKTKSKEAYEDAWKAAEEDIPVCHHVRLGLALNFSVFYFEIMSDKEKACQLAKQAFEAAIEEMDKLEEEYKRDSTFIMQLLRDNLALWTQKSESDEGRL